MKINIQHCSLCHRSLLTLARHMETRHKKRRLKHNIYIVIVLEYKRGWMIYWLYLLVLVEHRAQGEGVVVCRGPVHERYKGLLLVKSAF